MGRKNRRKKEHIRPVSKSIAIQPKRLEIWYASLPLDESTSVQGGSRPVIIISNDISNERSSIVTVIPMTTKVKHTGMPTHVVMGESMILAEQILTIDKKLLNKKIGDCSGMAKEIKEALMEQIGLSPEGELSELPEGGRKEDE